MSFLDKLTKAVSDTVDRGKKEVDEFMRIQKVKGEISEAERRIQEATDRIADIKRTIGDRVVDLLRSGALVQPELQSMAEPVGDFERHIEEQRAMIADKKVEIERIKAEGDQVPTPPAPVAPPPPDAVPAAPPVSTSTAAGPKFCASCGKPVAPGAEVCGGCGAQLR